MRIAVCAATYRRPQGLARLLEGLARLAFPATPPEIRIIIVDNDEAGGGRDVCEAARAALTWPLEYVVEPQRGISEARNAALDHAGDAEWIAFIDDDEEPAPDWLAELIRVQRECDADVVAGPVASVFETPPPKWAAKGRFFQAARHATGTRLPYAFTSNVLFRASILRETGVRFDPALSLAGGGDRMFFQRIGQAGYAIVWADDAVVRETVPASRMTRRWVWRRAFRYGVSGARIDGELRPGIATRLRIAALGAYRVAKGTLLLLPTAPFGAHHVVTNVRHVCYGVGMWLGAAGYRYPEYRQTHGS